MTKRRLIFALGAAIAAAVVIAMAVWRPWRPSMSVSVEVRGAGSVSRMTLGEGGTSSAGKNKFEIRGGRAIANGHDGGPLQSGDSVLLDNDGRLLVNGQERTIRAPLSGIAVEVRGKPGEESIVQGGEGTTVSAGRNTFEIRNGRAIANGNDCGTLKAGDSVLLDQDGRLFVNGQERTPK